MFSAVYPVGWEPRRGRLNVRTQVEKTAHLVWEPNLLKFSSAEHLAVNLLHPTSSIVQVVNLLHPV